MCSSFVNISFLLFVTSSIDGFQYVWNQSKRADLSSCTTCSEILSDTHDISLIITASSTSLRTRHPSSSGYFPMGHGCSLYAPVLRPHAYLLGRRAARTTIEMDFTRNLLWYLWVSSQLFISLCGEEVGSRERCVSGCCRPPWAPKAAGRRSLPGRYTEKNSY